MKKHVYRLPTNKNGAILRLALLREAPVHSYSYIINTDYDHTARKDVEM